MLLDKIKLLVGLEWTVIMLFTSANDAPQINILVKDFPGVGGPKVFLVPEDDPSSYQVQHIQELSNPLSGFIYNSVTQQVLLPQSNIILSMTVNSNTTTQFADVGSVGIQGLALDVTNGDVYFVGTSSVPGVSSSIIGVVNASDGAAYNILEAEAAIYKYVTFDYENKDLFWVFALSTTGRILKRNIHGSTSTNLLSHTDSIFGLTIDLQDARLYWSSFASEIYSCDLDGGGKQTFFNVLTGLQIIDLKVFGDYVYYVSRIHLTVTRVNKTDKNDYQTMGPITIAEGPYHLDVYASVTSCSLNDLVNVQLPANCTASVGESCDYSCDYGYKKNESIASLNCTQSGSWSFDDSILCIEIICNTTDIVNAQLPANCTAKVGESCNDFTCAYRYERNTAIVSLNCTETGLWNHNLSTLCIETLCETDVPNGKLAGTCENTVGDACNNFSCNYGYHQTEAIDTFNCTESGDWSYDLSQLCIETLCERNFTHGKLADTCNVSVGDTCNSFTCDYGYKEKANVDPINCTEAGTWNYDMSSLCIETFCNNTIPNGEMDDSCGLKVGDLCSNFTCNNGFKRSENAIAFNCTESGTWSYSLSTLCSEILCPIEFMNGNVSETCGLNVGDSCNSFNCDYGFTKETVITPFNCTESGTWSYNLTMLCTEILCERNFSNGELSHTCGINVGSSCDNFTCDYKYHEKQNVDAFSCTESGTWNYDMSSLCIETLCPREIPNGDLVGTCGLKVGNSCDDFLCDYGYEKKTNVSPFNCTQSGTWNYNLSSLCIEITCSNDDIVNAQLPGNCSSTVGEETCNSFSCNYGYERNPAVDFLNCTDSGLWNYNLSILCIETVCPRNFSNGQMAADCGLKVGNTCDNFTCKSGFKKKENVEPFNCTAAGTWSVDVATLCIEITCSGSVLNGSLPAGCQSKAGESCDDFTCNLGFMRNENISQLACSLTGTWSSNLSSLCVAAKCPTAIGNGQISVNCSTDVNASCDTIVCDQGYTRNDNVISLVCNETGSWDYNISFQCDSMDNAISCLVKQPSETLLEYWIDELGDTCDYNICDSTYRQRNINDSVVCVSNTNWKNYNTVLCSASDCSRGEQRGHAYSSTIWAVTTLGIIINLAQRCS